MNLLLAVLALASSFESQVVQVASTSELRSALRAAKPGTTIEVAAGHYDGGIFAENLHGTAKRPIVLVARKGALIGGGANGIHLSRVSHLRIEGFQIEGSTGNGINIDDGGDRDRPSSHIRIVDVTISDLPKGNHDGIKLSGVSDFVIERATIRRWGGSGIDMVGCHDGLVKDCLFWEGGDNGVQSKGGSSNITIESCRFMTPGQRALNIGGSTGFAYFRPPLEGIPAGERYEAKNIVVQGCQIYGAVAGAAFVGVDGARFEFNTIHNPRRWAFRILQETRDPSFLPSRNGRIAKNLIIFNPETWSEGGVNIGPGVDPGSFQFEENFWYCQGRPERSRPTLPTAERNGTYGVDPKEKLLEVGVLGVEPGSPAAHVGAHAFRPR